MELKTCVPWTIELRKKRTMKRIPLLLVAFLFIAGPSLRAEDWTIDTAEDWTQSIESAQGATVASISRSRPDIAFAEGKFYLATQQKTDYTSPGPWVETVEARVGVDTDNDRKIDHWTDWNEIKESYDYIPGFSKQIARTPAELDLATLPDGFGFQIELRITDSTENKSKPIVERMSLSFGN